MYEIKLLIGVSKVLKWKLRLELDYILKVNEINIKLVRQLWQRTSTHLLTSLRAEFSLHPKLS